MGKHVETPSIKQRAVAIVASGALALSAVGAPAVAFAVEASTGAQTGTGATEVTVQLIDADTEHGGTEDPTNPDENDDDLGDNIAFTVPSSINFVAKADGTLIGPSAANTYIENESVFAIHASSMKVDAEGGWTIVPDASASDGSDVADFTFGPTGDILNAANYLTKRDVGDASKWNMTAKKSDPSTTDRVQLNTAGHIANVEKEIKAKTKIATVHTYVKPGVATAG